MLALLLRTSATDPHLAERLRPVIWMLLLAHLVAGAQRRGGPAPRGRRAVSVRLPRRSLPPHSSVAGRRPRG
ncbi:MAG: hypothetical protein QOF04_2649 [Solirubrobacteraceae bacterium]|jgi:hypothetical protein|nr:hypothetical protein [Solirubrobacteraceae bacterium]